MVSNRTHQQPVDIMDRTLTFRVCTRAAFGEDFGANATAMRRSGDKNKKGRQVRSQRLGRLEP